MTAGAASITQQFLVATPAPHSISVVYNPSPNFSTSNVTKSGSTISGNIAGLVVVKTDPGYEPNPGHAGTGTVVAVIP